MPWLLLVLREETTDIPCSWPWHSLPAYCFIVPELPARTLLLLNRRSAASGQILHHTLIDVTPKETSNKQPAQKIPYLSLFLMKANLDIHKLDTEFEQTCLAFFKSTFYGVWIHYVFSSLPYFYCSHSCITFTYLHANEILLFECFTLHRPFLYAYCQSPC